MSSKSKKSKKSPFRKKSSKSKLSSTAASILNLSPVVEANEDSFDFDNIVNEGAYGGTFNEYNSGSTGSGDGNYGGDCNLRGLNADDWDNENEYHESHQSTQLFPQHQLPGEQGGADTGFDSERNYNTSDRRAEEYSQQQQQQQNYRSARNQREPNRRRFKVNSDSITPPLPYSDGGSYSSSSHGSNGNPYQNNAENTSGYNIAADTSVGYSATSSSTPIMPLPGFEEADLLQRAIERRALLHNRIVAMEAAKAELEMDGGQNSQGENQEKIHPRRRHPQHKDHKRTKQKQQQQADASVPKGYQSTSMRHPPPDHRPYVAERTSGDNRKKQSSFSDDRNNVYKPFDEDHEDRFDADDTHGHLEDNITNRSGNMRMSITNSSGRMRMGEHHRRMNEISDRIKKEALEFMNFESSYADENEKLISSHLAEGRLENAGLNVDPGLYCQPVNGYFAGESSMDDIQEGGKDDTSDDESSSSYTSDRLSKNQSPLGENDENQSHNSSTSGESTSGNPDGESAVSIDTSAWGDGKPTTQQLTRYSNMVRLGIPDVAVIRSMERDGVTNTQSILSSLKQEHGISSSTGGSTTRSPGRSNFSSSTKKSARGDEEMNIGDDGDQSGRRLTLPLCEDSNYSKYFKMVKAKVPHSWVKRVLEVDGKDARVLDLDPDRPLADQVQGAVDEFGNVDWNSVKINRTSSASADNSDNEEAPVSATTAQIPADTFASVKAELAAMTAKAGGLASGLTAVPSDESSPSGSESGSQHAGGSTSTTRARASAGDISSAAVAASNARMIRLRAIRAGKTGGESSDSKSGVTDIGRRRQNVDEIRRRLPSRKAPGQTDRRNHPSTSSLQSSNEHAGGSAKQRYNDIPLKDDPRFSKYFQMIRSRVPRSWVERVIEVDDRDPAVLDLDPNKSLASQIGEEGAEELLDKDDNDTVDSTYASLDASERSSLSHSTRRSATASVVDKSEHIQRPDETSGEALENRLPVTQICDDANSDDDRSVASSITANRETVEEKSSLDLTKISSYLDRIDARMNGRDSDEAVPPRFSTTEEVEKRLSEIIGNFGSRKSKEAQNEVSNEQKQLMEKSQADIAKLSALLATKIGQPDAGAEPMPAQQVTVTKQSDLETLPSLLSQVLEKMEQPHSGEPEQGETESRKVSPNKALEALFAKRAALSEEEDSKPKIIGEDPEYAKYFKMQKLGLPRASVIQALERDGKDVTIIDLDPNLPLAEQKRKIDEPAVPDKNSALKDLFSKRAAAMEDKPAAPDKNVALKALFAKRSAETKNEGSTPALKSDPEFQKYMKMLKVGMPKETVRQALERDGKDQSVADMDPEKSYASQVKRAGDDEKKSSPPLKDDPEYAKFFKMLKMGIPAGAVRQALQKEKKDPNIVDMDPEKSYKSQVKGTDGDGEKNSGPPLKDDPEYSKFFKMLKMGIPMGAVRQAVKKAGKDPDIVDMDPEKSYDSQVKGNDGGSDKNAGPPLKDDPEYTKYFKMLKMGLPLGAVQNALKKDGKDPEIVNMDPEKSYNSQVKEKCVDVGPPLKDDPEYVKFFKMLKMGIPVGAVQNAMKKEGKDPNIITLDPEKTLSVQQSKPKDAQKPPKPKGPKVARKRLHWNKIDESKLHENSFWNQAQSSVQLVGLDVDNEEFASLFTSPLNKSAAPKKDSSSNAKKPLSSKQKVQLIDARRRMNGSILLTKFKVDYKVLAKQVDNMEYIEAEGNEIRGMMQLLPTKDESLALRSYLPPSDAPQSEIEESIAKLGECEQYMAVMFEIPDAKGKFQSMLFRSEFENQADTIRDGTKMLIQACDSVKNSERFRKLLLYALKLGNALNTGGSNEAVKAITLDSLLKLAESKAFDRQTSVLHYLVSIVQKNDEDVLKLSEDFVPVKAAERVAMDMLAQSLKEMEMGIKLVKDVVKRNLPERDISVDAMPEDESLGATPMGRFSLSAASKIQSLSNEFNDAQENFADLLQFFGEDTSMNPEAFFCTINTFVALFDQTHKELKKKEEAKERKKRIDEKRKLREQEMAAKKLKAK